jgi:hypothetical protein
MKRTIAILMILSMLPVMALASGCGSSSPAAVSSPTIPSNPSVVTPPVTPSPTDKPSNPSTPVPPPQSTVQPLKTDVIYFHMTQRCVTCLCFESRIKWVVTTYFKDAISSGKMSFYIINAQERQNAVIATKYGAVGSQLFVNTIVNGVDHIKDIQAIWDWNCNGDATGFNDKVRNIIEQSLKGQF